MHVQTAPTQKLANGRGMKRYSDLSDLCTFHCVRERYRERTKGHYKQVENPEGDMSTTYSCNLRLRQNCRVGSIVFCKRSLYSMFLPRDLLEMQQSYLHIPTNVTVNYHIECGQQGCFWEGSGTSSKSLLCPRCRRGGW